MKRHLAVGIASVLIALSITACEGDGCDESNPCDENGESLIFMPYWYPGGPLGGPHWIQPGQTGYQPTYQNKPPTYKPPSSVRMPTPGYKPPAPKPASPPKVNAPAAPKPVTVPKVR